MQRKQRNRMSKSNHTIPVESGRLTSNRSNHERYAYIPQQFQVQNGGHNHYNSIMNHSQFRPNPNFNRSLMQYMNPDHSFARNYFMPIGRPSSSSLHSCNTEVLNRWSKDNVTASSQNYAIGLSHEATARNKDKASLKISITDEKKPNVRVKLEDTSGEENSPSSEERTNSPINFSPIKATSSPQNMDVSSIAVKNEEDTEESLEQKVSSRGSLKSNPRVKHFFKRIEAERKQMEPLQQRNIESLQTDQKISFEKISSHYPSVPSNLNKRCSSGIASSSTTSSPATVPSISEESAEKENKRPKTIESSNNTFGNLNILCQAVNMVTVINKQENELKHSIVMKNMVRSKTCSCPRSRCIKLYCECFQEGRLCSISCSCKKCKNTQEETGPHGLRTKAINGILSRNPHAFSNNKTVVSSPPIPYDGISCRCVKSQCLKLYCDCFQSSQVCGSSCLCINCLNTSEESGSCGKRSTARMLLLQRNPDAFKPRVKNTTTSCSCRNNRYVDSSMYYVIYHS